MGSRGVDRPLEEANPALHLYLKYNWTAHSSHCTETGLPPPAPACFVSAVRC